MRELIQSKWNFVEPDESILTLKYGDFKDTEEGQEKLKKYLDIWEQFGFIAGIKGELRERLAVAYEQMTVYFLTNDYVNEDSPLIFLSMVRRVCCSNKLNVEFDTMKFVKYCEELNLFNVVPIVHEVCHKRYDADELPQIDPEAEFCKSVSQMLIRKFNGEAITFDDIKDELINILKIDKTFIGKKFSELKETEDGRKMIESCLNTWDKNRYIIDENDERLSVAYEQMALHMLVNVENADEIDFWHMRFMMKIILVGHMHLSLTISNPDLFNCEDFIKYYREIDPIKFIYHDDRLYNGVNDRSEIQAKTLLAVCEMIIRRFNGDETSFKDMKEEYLNSIKSENAES